MGPPKIKARAQLSIDEYRRQLDTFEYRWSADTEAYYMFCPYTGETIFEANAENVGITTRHKSMWYKAERCPTVNAETTLLYPEFYASRRWGRRKFYGWASMDAAATHIAAVIRGGMVRRSLRWYYRQRYAKQVCKFSGYYFFVDEERPDDETSWYKPLLAFPGDIILAKDKVSDPDDHMKGMKFSKMNFEKGPFHRVAGLSKNAKARTGDDVRKQPSCFYFMVLLHVLNLFAFYF